MNQMKWLCKNDIKVSALSNSTVDQWSTVEWIVLTASRALVIDPMNQLVCRTNKQLTRSMIDGTKVACIAHPLNARISVRWFHQRYHDRVKPVNITEG